MTETIELSSIIIEGRHRRDFGDIDALARSIDDVGLLQPIAIRPDLVLVAGERRIRAVQLLGHDVIEAHIVHGLDEAVAALRAERDENTCRKDFTPTEEHDLYAALLELERPKAQERKASSQAKPGEGKTGAAKFAGPTAEARKLAAAGASGKPGRHTTLDKVGEVKAAAEDEALPEPVREVAKRALEEMDGTGRVDGAYQKVKAATKAAAADPIGDLLEGDQSIQDAEYVSNFVASFKRDSAWLGFDAERVGRLIDDTELRLLSDRASTVEKFVRTVQQARVGLRLINGGTQ